MPGQARAHLVVGRIGRVAAGIARRGHPHARLLPQAPLGAPEAAEAELHFLETRGKRRLQRVAIHVVAVGNRQRAVAPRQGLLGAGQRELVGKDR
ncbi:hypothetical protein D3C78_1426690 [compost metagenome]